MSLAAASTGPSSESNPVQGKKSVAPATASIDQASKSTPRHEGMATVKPRMRKYTKLPDRNVKLT